ncbi:hypothetical protein PsYK624_147860 [Phanerochaete sordida]|uniref:BTB domain-containing protein n=1 Tax=Phanerochaete sordida TaxID=48140 RepID=A0A9P3GSG5_9APHY|nr:hypothetical protein PsYK624_147860 [Phanerochaete sordida]
MPPGSKPKPKVSPHPAFNKPSADVILRSSDKIDFHVHKVVLSDASSFFETMFALPQEPGAPLGGAPSLPVVPMQENAKTLLLLLETFYPGKGISINTPSRASDLLAVADKYAMDGVATHVKRTLECTDLSEGGYLKIMSIYALARRHNFMDLAARAARASLKHPLVTYSLTGLATLPLTHYNDLLSYREACVALIDGYLPDEEDMDDDGWDGALADVWDWGYSGRLKCNVRDDSEIVILNLDDCEDCRGRLWLRLHVQRLKAAFSASVCGASVQDISLIDKTVASIGCDECLEKAPMELLEFSKRLGDKLDHDLLAIEFKYHVFK